MRLLPLVVTLAPALLAGGLFARGVAEIALHVPVPYEAAAFFAPKEAAAATEKVSLVKAVADHEPVPAVVAPIAEPVHCTTPGRVVVTVADPDAPARSFAVVSVPGGKGMVQRGTAISGRPVLAVTGSRVWLGGANVCYLDAVEGGSAKPEPPKTGLESPLVKGIAKIDENHVRIERSVRDRIFESGGADFAKTLRFAPSVVDGKIVGMKILSVQPDSLLAKLGLKTGDELKSVNSMPIGGPEQMLELYGKLRTAPSLDFEIVRGGARTVVGVTVE
jgi:type II secretory pathway component PulC